MLIGYMRVSSADERQSVDLQRDALIAAGVDERHLHQDRASGARDDRPGLKACLADLRPGDVLVVWKLDRLGRSLSHLIRIIDELEGSGMSAATNRTPAFCGPSRNAASRESRSNLAITSVACAGGIPPAPQSASTVDLRHHCQEQVGRDPNPRTLDRHRRTPPLQPKWVHRDRAHARAQRSARTRRVRRSSAQSARPAPRGPAAALLLSLVVVLVLSL